MLAWPCKTVSYSNFHALKEFHIVKVDKVNNVIFIVQQAL